MNANLIMTRRIGQLAIGLFLYGLGIAMMVRASVGVAPWDVLTQGINIKTQIPFGVITIVVGAIVLLLWIPLRQRPGVGTILNVLLVGPSIDIGLAILPSPDILWVQVVLFAGGLVVLAIATGLYLGARMGSGPRDGLMIGINARFGVRIWIARTSVEIVVLIAGWILGGNVGFGTLAFALLIGPLVNITIPRLRVPLAAAPKEPALVD